MIALYTDFGWQGPYVGQMKAVLHRHAPNVPVVDLMHDAPRFNPRAAAYLLAASIRPFVRGVVFLCVVDPGVGDPRRPALALQADGRWFVGPGNGLLEVVAARSEKHQWHRIDWSPPRLSDSFHGRDLFAVVAAEAALARTDKLVALSDAQAPVQGLPPALHEIIYIDAYGNAMTGLPGANYERTRTLEIGGQQLRYARTFSEVEAGQGFWYVNALDLVELAVNQGDAARSMGIAIGDRVSFSD